jgi:hypothetical protein
MPCVETVACSQGCGRQVRRETQRKPTAAVCVACQNADGEALQARILALPDPPETDPPETDPFVGVYGQDLSVGMRHTGRFSKGGPR